MSWIYDLCYYLNLLLFLGVLLKDCVMNAQGVQNLIVNNKLD
jgi:hypothetical protein